MMRDRSSYYDMIGFMADTGPTEDGLPQVPDLAHTALFLDFDGTLVDIAERPDAIAVKENLEEILLKLDERTGGAVAIVSDRPLADLERRLPRWRGTLIGSQGAERRHRGRTDIAPEAGAEKLAELVDIVRTWAAHHDAVMLEEKPASLALHFRRAPELQPDCVRLLHALTENLDDYVVRHASMAVELMPARICKRCAVEELMQDWAGRIPVAIGDDQSDEGMLALAEEMGGWGVKVGDADTVAGHRVQSVADLHRGLLSWLIPAPASVPAPARTPA